MFRTAYGEKVVDNLVCSDPSLTHQSFGDKCNINKIMAKYQKSGVIDHLNKYQGSYGDFSELASYQDALNLVQNADDMFSSLPSSIRNRFSNDPGIFLDFVNDEKNIEEMYSLGLAVRPADAVVLPEVNEAAEPTS